MKLKVFVFQGGNRIEEIEDLVKIAKEKESNFLIFPFRYKERKFLDFSQELARKYKIFLLPGIYEEENKIKSFLFFNDGSLSFFEPLENPLKIISTPFGNLGFIYEEDVFKPEISRKLALKGVSIVIHIFCMERPYYFFKQISGLWREVQANQFIGIDCPFISEETCGEAMIILPCEITKDRSGILKRSNEPYKEELIWEEVDFNDLERIRKEYPILSLLNFKLYEKFIPEIYGED